MKSRLISVIFISLSLLSCKKEKPTNGMFNEDGTISDSMMSVVKGHLNDAKISADSIVKSRPQKVNTEVAEEIKSEESQISNKKFVFVVLKVSEATEIGADYKKYQTKELVSGINEISNYDEDAKAMLEDQIIQEYKMGAWSGNIISKETFAFDNYSSASKKRNTYLIEQ